MQIILSDHNCEGQAQAIFDVIKQDAWMLELVPMKLQWFRDMELPDTADDEVVWRFCQEHGYLLLTGNRTADDGDRSLELVMRRLVTPTSLPVLTIGNLKRVIPDFTYRRRCADRLADIVADLDARFRGTSRLFLP